MLAGDRWAHSKARTLTFGAICHFVSGSPVALWPSRPCCKYSFINAYMLTQNTFNPTRYKSESNHTPKQGTPNCKQINEIQVCVSDGFYEGKLRSFITCTGDSGHQPNFRLIYMSWMVLKDELLFWEIAFSLVKHKTPQRPTLFFFYRNPSHRSHIYNSPHSRNL